MKRSQSNLPLLVRVLIAKSILDVLLVAAFALGFYYSAFNTSLRGSLDEAGPEWIRGWVLDFSKRDLRPEVQLYIDGHFAESRIADFPHPNLVVMGLAPDDRHGFFFYTPPLDPGRHEARAYVVYKSGGGERRTLQQLGSPLNFVIDAAPAEPYFKGWVDSATAVAVKGWVISKDAPLQPVEVELYIDNRLVETRLADYPRPDLKAGVLAEGDKVGFMFLTPKLLSGTHEARVYAVRKSDTDGRRSLRLIGRTLVFTV
jgi:hypothetical protein